MANEGDPERPGSVDWSERPPEWTALVERVARLELELAALHGEITAKGVDVDRSWRPAAARTATPPPPPVPVLDSAAEDRSRLAA